MAFVAGDGVAVEAVVIVIPHRKTRRTGKGVRSMQIRIVCIELGNLGEFTYRL